MAPCRDRALTQVCCSGTGEAAMNPLERLRISIVIIFICLLAVTVPIFNVSAEKRLKVAFILYGPTGDYGWSFQHFVGAKSAEGSLRDQVEVTIAENVSTGPLGQRVIQALAAAGNHLIFTTS